MERTRGIQVKQLRAGYTIATKLLPAGRRVIVDGLSFEVRPGEIAGILGANGSAKSTILKAIVDSRSRFGGEVLVDGASLTPGQIAYVPQTPAGTLSPWLDVRSEIALPRRTQFIPRNEWKAAVDELTEELRIGLPLDRRVEWLSGGQRVKVALLRALAVPDRRIFVLDEPFEGLDASTRSTVIQLIRSEVERGIPVVITSHRAEDLHALGARMLTIVGAPVTELVEEPSSPHVRAASTAQVGQRDDMLSTAPVTPDAGQAQRRTTAVLFGTLGFFCGAAAWAVISAIVDNPGLVPSPLSVLREMIRLPFSSSLAPHFVSTMLRAIAGWTVANLAAVPVGILLGYDIRCFQAVAPWLSIGRALPIFVLVAPAAGVFPRLPEAQRGSLIFLTLFVISLQVVSASAALAPRRRLNIARVFGASHWFRLSRIMPFEAIGGIFAALEITLPLSVIVTLVLETFLIPKSGLGLYVFNHLNDADSSLLFAHILWPAVIVAIALAIVRSLSRSFRYDL